MALRIRKDGTVICAAQSYAHDGDTYIDDVQHHALAEHFAKPESEEDRNWAALFGRCLDNGEDPRKYWQPAIDDIL